MKKKRHRRPAQPAKKGRYDAVRDISFCAVGECPNEATTDTYYQYAKQQTSVCSQHARTADARPFPGRLPPVQR